jgi:hypothetical protein
MPSGTTAQRPTGVNGQIRYNSTENAFEGYANGAWGEIGGGGGVGITEIDAWRISASTTVTNNNTIATNWERGSGDGFDKLGTGLSESSGEFSFPSTGYWWINVFATYNRTNGSSSQAGISLNYTSDNFSGNSDAAEGEDSSSATNFRSHVSFTFMFKITDITNQKFRFRMLSSSPSGTEFIGNAGKSLTGFSIFKAAEV